MQFGLNPSVRQWTVQRKDETSATAGYMLLRLTNRDRQDHSEQGRSSSPMSRCRVWCLVCLTPLIVAVWASAALGSDVSAGQTLSSDRPKASTAAPSQRSVKPLADPVVSADADLKAGRAITWTDGRGQMLLLDREVSVAIGAYGFRAKRAVVRIATDPHPGRLVHRLAIYLHSASPLRGLGPVEAQAPRLLVTASIAGRVGLVADLMRHEDSVPDDPWVGEANERIGRYLKAAASPSLDVPEGKKLFDKSVEALKQYRRQQIAWQAQQKRLTGSLPVKGKDRAVTRPAESAPVSGLPVRPIMSTGGTVSFHADKLIYQQDQNQDQSTLALMGNVQVVYQNPGRRQGMSLRAENAVIFLAPGAMDRLGGHSANAEDVRGFYLEDNVVATDGQYTVRAPRVYYDLVRNKAVVLHAVFYTWDVRHRVPIYVRAQKLRQESLTHWSAHQAVLTTSEFAQPHFSIASDRIEFRQQNHADRPSGYRFAAKNSTMRWGELPLFYWPYLAGDAQMLREKVLPRVSASYGDQDGLVVRSRWNLFAVAGQPDPDGVKLRGRLDYLGDRGPATGVNLKYTLPQMFGTLDSYIVLRDDGDDEISGRRRLEHDGDTRGYALWRHRQYLRDSWELSIEGSHVSDETFLEEFFKQEAEVSKPYETSIYLKKQEGDRAFTFLAGFHAMDFTAQTTTLQSPGYTVEKTPQLGYHRIGASLWRDRLTYTTETSVSRMRIRAGKDRPASRGFDANASTRLFGLAVPQTRFEDAVDTAGIPSNHRWRLDSRHEIQSPLKMGVLDLVPYVVGRVTLYDDDFDEFAGEDDPLRLWSSLGLRVHTQVSKIYEDVRVPALDVNRLRHVIEPRIDLFWSGSTINSDDIPVYDSDVEDLSEGLGLRVGGRHILQTQRGGPGRWRSVDWLVVGADLVLRSDDSDVDTDIARFFSYRPELSRGGDHFHADLMWMVSDVLATVGQLTYSLEDSLVSQWRLGVSLQHTPRLSFFTDYSEIDVLSSRLLTYGLSYRLTSKYSVHYAHTLDLGGNESRHIAVTLERRLPRWNLQVVARIDDIEDEASFGVVLLPEGLRASGSSLSTIGR